MSANKKGTVEVPEEQLAGSMVHMRLPIRHVALLLEQGLMCGLVEGKKATGTVNTYEVRGEDFNQIANLLHYDPDQLTLNSSEEGGYFELVVRWKVYTDRSYATSDGNACPSSLKPMFEEGLMGAAIAMEQNIWYFNAHGSTKVWNTSQCPHFIISTYTSGSGWGGHRELFGVSLPGGGTRDGNRPRTMMYSDQDPITLHDDRGIEYGLFTQARLFIYPDLPHNESYDLTSLLFGVSNSILDMFGDPAEIQERKTVAFKDMLGRWLSTVPEKKMVDLKYKLSEAERYLAEGEENLVRRRREYTESMFAFTVHKENKTELFDVGAAVDSVIDLVNRSKEFTTFSSTGQWLEVETEDIFIPHPYDKGDGGEPIEYYMGKYRIRINPVDGGVELPMSHKPPEKVEGKEMVHPHASSSYDICWGNVGTPIYELIQVGDFVQAIHLITNYLRHVNGHEETMEEYWYTKEECMERGVIFE